MGDNLVEGFVLQELRIDLHNESEVSKWVSHTNGLPQGSVIAPTLFIADDICCGVRSISFVFVLVFQDRTQFTMDKFVSLFARAHKTRSFNDDDFVDRLSSRYTVVILVGFAILVCMTSYVRNPITCWGPKPVFQQQVEVRKQLLLGEEHLLSPLGEGRAEGI